MPGQTQSVPCGAGTSTERPVSCWDKHGASRVIPGQTRSVPCHAGTNTERPVLCRDIHGASRVVPGQARSVQCGAGASTERPVSCRDKHRASRVVPGHTRSVPCGAGASIHGASRVVPGHGALSVGDRSSALPSARTGSSRTGRLLPDAAGTAVRLQCGSWEPVKRHVEARGGSLVSSRHAGTLKLAATRMARRGHVVGQSAPWLTQKRRADFSETPAW